MDTEKEVLSANGSIVPVRNKVLQLLCYFVENPERVVSKEELLDALWSNGEYRERSLSQSILELRKILGDSASNPTYIRTVPNQGYKWLVPIKSFEPTKSLPRGRLMAIVAFVCVVVVGCLTLMRTGIDYSDRNVKVMVLPFQNHTRLSSYQWVEYGLSDMLATDLMLSSSIQVYPPSSVTPFNNDIDKWTQKTFQDSAVDVVIQASVYLGNGKQRLMYKVLDSDLHEVKGEVEKEDLALSMPSIASMIVRTLRPKEIVEDLPKYTFKVDAMHEYAKGQHALNQQGCELAQHYFAASYTIEPSHEWSVLQYAICQAELGEGDVAKGKLLNLLTSSKDAIVQALSNVWLANLYMTEGELALANQHLKNSSYSKVIDSNYSWFEFAKETAYYLEYLNYRLGYQELMNEVVVPESGVPPWHSKSQNMNIEWGGALSYDQQSIGSLITLSRSVGVEPHVRLKALEEAIEINKVKGSIRIDQMLSLESIYWLIKTGDLLEAQAMIQRVTSTYPNKVVQVELDILSRMLEQVR
ncbi:winged helix-turn-helix domain-containing protein [Vibrio profundi]|uniref:winged helix-turn-helix domain-containing protein n=1 Tax=Vibrio profundi TaxID=1774960 RepID=UPI003734E9D5